ncbi:MAG: LysR substrate-binding domain-containing protein [Gammaproteobacteria bacterium]|nr:LysR substrate-binding domain-containing protein [Gammaproteobacteria bacterium]MDH5800616.1 LysR substrate-binding domain-containing protein [Gammaproteobacteria bacterium]
MDRPLPSALARRISFRQLQVFESIARNESFTRAAEELFLTQPTVSMQIKKLQENVGTTLFDHIGKKVFLTETGKELFKSTRGILEHLSYFEMQASDLQGMKAGHLRLAVVTTAKYYAPYKLGLFCQQYPGIEVSLKVTNRERILERLHQNEDDLYIIGQPPEDKNHCFTYLVENPLVVIAAKDYHLTRVQGPLTAKHIATQPFIIRELGSGTRSAVENYFRRCNLSLNIKMELGSNEAIKHAVASGLGVSVVSRHTLSMELRNGPVVELDVDGFPISWPWYIGYPAGKNLSVVAKTFLDFVHKKAIKT